MAKNEKLVSHYLCVTPYLHALFWPLEKPREFGYWLVLISGTIVLAFYEAARQPSYNYYKRLRRYPQTRHRAGMVIAQTLIYICIYPLGWH